VEVNLSTSFSGSGTIDWDDGPPDGNYSTDLSGRAESTFYDFEITGGEGVLTFTWTFVSRADGCDTFATTYTCPP
jgi:hypothetical protein